ncbi:transcriptional regulators [Paucimonas lemoignei]|nr:transcriptional regulators [Paucimonas lemoignei]
MAAKSLDAETIKGKLLQGSFMNNGPVLSQLTDPIADTPMVITLDKLRPYEHNPRINRNPLFVEIKASIKTRGLEAPPPITRRPGDEFYIIRNGGNTRLAILNELWTETRDEQFLRIQCLFRPWPKRGDIVALTGHLAENDMHGELTFIERALGIEQARAFYELEAGQPVSQRELARLLAADGYPVSQPHISRMQDTVQHLLPAIPSVLYAGLGKPQIERLIALRRGAEKTWQQHAGNVGFDFSSLFTEVLAGFDDKPDFSYERFQDELIHQMQQPLGKDYNWLKLDILDGRATEKAPVVPPTRPAATSSSSRQPAAEADGQQPPSTRIQKPTPPEPDLDLDLDLDLDQQALNIEPDPTPISADDQQALIQAHIISPIAGLTPRIQAMKRQLAQATGEPIPDFETTCLHAIPVQVGGLHPVSDLWYIER